MIDDMGPPTIPERFYLTGARIARKLFKSKDPEYGAPGMQYERAGTVYDRAGTNYADTVPMDQSPPPGKPLKPLRRWRLLMGQRQVEEGW